jgi:Lar family restriction alleviation protein
MNEVVPCPFCGKSHVTVVAGRQGVPAGFWVTCVTCLSEGPWASTEAEAIVKWNTRVEVKGEQP